MENKKRFISWGAVFVYALLIFYLSSLEQPPAVGVSNFDKVLHAFEYCIFSILIFRALLVTNKNGVKNRIIFLAVLFSTLYGLSDEVHQYFVPTRQMSGIDLLFDFFGSFAGVLLYNKIKYGSNKRS